MQKKNVLCRPIIFAIIISWYSSLATAAQFEAIVNSTNISLQQTIKLKLILTDASAKNPPQLNALEDSFVIQGTQKFKNYSSVNGKALTEEGWQIVLRPKMAGELIIPAISINTTVGVFSSQAIHVYVDGTAHAADLPVKIEGVLEKSQVFIQEAFIYKVNIFNASAIANAHLDKLEIADCVVDQIGEPKRKQVNKNGKNLQVTEIQYLITPLKSGQLTIPAVTLRGEVQMPQGQNSTSFDPFDNISLLGIRPPHAYEPFVVATAEQVIKVLSAEPEVQPWLPLYDLQITQEWQGLEQAMVGEPITRKVSVKAIGATGQQLPSLKALHEIDGVKVYADNPVLNFDYDASSRQLTGSRIEQISLIPTKDGTLTLPEIAIAWWDLKQNKKMVAYLPAQLIDVLPAVAAAASHSQARQAASGSAKGYTLENKASTDKQWAGSTINKKIKILYFIVALLLLVIVAVVLFVWRYMKRMQALLQTKSSQQNATASPHAAASNKVPGIKFINDLSSLQSFIRNYACSTWGLAENVALTEVVAELKKIGYEFDEVLAENLFAAIDRAAYGKEQASLDELKTMWYELQKNIVLAKKTLAAQKKAVASLNPT